MPGFNAIGLDAIGVVPMSSGTVPPADTTAPVLTGAVTITVVTSSGGHAAWPAATDDTAVTGYEISCDTGTPVWVDVGANRAADISGKSAATAYTVRVRAYDAAGNRSVAITGTLTTSAAADTTAPTMGGSVAISAISASGAHAAWSAGSDNVAVTGYEVSCDTGTASWVDVGNVLGCDITGKAASTAYTVRVRAYDAAGNRSIAITGSLTTGAAADVQAPTLSAASSAPNGANAATGSVTTDEGNGTLYCLASTSTSLTAAQVKAAGAAQAVSSAGAKTVAVSGLTAATVYYLYFMHEDAAGNDSAVLRSASFTTASAPVVPSTITVPASRTAVFAANPRVAVFNTAAPITLNKGALDELYFTADFTKDLADGATTLQSIAAVPGGVTVLEGPTPQGSLGLVKLGAIDLAVATPYFTFRLTLANGEIVDRTILLTVADDRSKVFGKDPDDRRYFAIDVTADLALSANTSLATLQSPVVAGVTSTATPVKQGKQVIVQVGGLSTADGAVNSLGVMMAFANGEKLYRTIYFAREDH